MKKRNGRRVWKVLAFAALLGIGAVAVVWARRRAPHLPAAPQERVQPTHPVLIVNPLSGKNMMNLFATHPPLEERIARLRGQPASRGPGKATGGHKDRDMSQARATWDRLSGKS